MSVKIGKHTDFSGRRRSYLLWSPEVLNYDMVFERYRVRKPGQSDLIWLKSATFIVSTSDTPFPDCCAVCVRGVWMHAAAGVHGA